ncbi:MAG: RNA polymerase Rpb4 family protein [Halobacteriales archaeon]
MTIFKEIKDEEYLTIAETKEILAEIEAERVDQEREMRYELARAIEHVNRLAALDGGEARELVEELLAFDHVDEAIAIKIADLLPRDRTELRSIYAQERYSLDGDELDEILDVVRQFR